MRRLFLIMLALLALAGCGQAAAPEAPLVFTKMQFTSGQPAGEVYYLTGRQATFGFMKAAARQFNGDLIVVGQQQVPVDSIFPIFLQGMLSGYEYQYNVDMSDGLIANGFIVVVLPRGDGTDGFVIVAQVRGKDNGVYTLDTFAPIPSTELIPIPAAATFR